ncbi:hypothetical protein ABZZ79_08580 [Streptomyces sp. NPDC006458]|uniref:hypothetical protein n=1 Tax=Streptomyces sp. NPDC006458 TaxID=3154302 RepID=UPI0033A5A87E
MTDHASRLLRENLRPAEDHLAPTRAPRPTRAVWRPTRVRAGPGGDTGADVRAVPAAGEAIPGELPREVALSLRKLTGQRAERVAGVG